MKNPAFRVARELLRRRILEPDFLAGLGGPDRVRVPWPEEPGILLRELAMNPAERLAKRNGLLDRLAGERRAARSVHHRSRDVVRHDDGIERRGRGMQHVRLVEPRMRDGAA